MPPETAARPAVPVPALAGNGHTLVQLIEARARRAPDPVALVCEGRRLTLGEVNARANGIARMLRARLGAGPEARVGVLATRDEWTVLGLLGVMKAGAAYVPIDPALPPERARLIATDARCVAVLSVGAAGEAARALAADGVPLADPRDGLPDPADPPAAAGPLNLAYVLYTSGSTGRPKPVGVEHRALTHLFHALEDVLYASGPAREALSAPFAFDASVQQALSCLANGSELHVVPQAVRGDPEAFVAFLAEHRITHMNAVASFVSALVETGLAARLPSSLRRIVTGGETVHHALLSGLFAVPACAGITVSNMYGPTENCVDTTCFNADASFPSRYGVVPVGRPLDGVRCWVLDDALRPVAQGETGEVWVSGAGLSRGYLDRPAATAASFVPSPFGDGERMYRTGDRGRWRPDGELEFLGRIDEQVKVRGHRIEPGEVETALRAHPAVAAVCVDARDEGGGARLLAYVVPSRESADAAAAEPGTTASDPLVAALRTHAEARLPAYMVPDTVVLLDALPLTPNGKVDRRALAALPLPDAPAPHGPAPRTPAEREVARAWLEALGRPPGLRDDFFALGGHSLKAAQVAGRLRQRLGVRIGLAEVMAHPTVEALAARVEDAERERTHAIPRAPDRPHHPMSHAQRRLWLLHQMDGGDVAYNVPVAIAAGMLDAEALRSAFALLAERHEALRTALLEVDGEPVQRIVPRVDVAVRVVELRDAADPEAEARRLAEREAAAPFDLAHPPLFRLALARVAEDRTLFLLTVHHTVVDGWSLALLLREAGEAYQAAVEGRTAALPPLPVRYRDYAEWHAARDFTAEERYWAGVLAGVPESLELPRDAASVADADFRGGTVEDVIGPEAAETLRTLARERGATLSAALLALYGVLLRRLSGRADLCVGMGAAGRSRPELEGVVGFFVNVLPVRFRVDGGAGLAPVLDAAAAAMRGALEHQDYPVDLLVRRLNPVRRGSRQPVFNVMFAYQNFADVRAGGGARGGPLDLSSLVDVAWGTSKFDLTLYVNERPDGGVRLAMEYDAALFRPGTVRGWLTDLASLARAAADGSVDAASSSAGVIEYEARVAALNGTARPYPREESIARLFTAQTARTPHAVAVVDADGSRATYAELDRESDAIARWLARRGAGPEVLVGAMLRRSRSLVTVMLGTWKAGAAYLPLHPDLPPERLRWMLGDTRAPVLIAARTDAGPANRLLWEAPHLRDLLLVDSGEASAEVEAAGARMSEELWDHVAAEAFDDISGGGWKSGYTGDWLSRAAMDEYAANVRAKLAPHLGPGARVLEVGCASGITLAALAPLVADYHATDLSAGMVRLARRRAAADGIRHARFGVLAAHEIGRIADGPYDAIVVNSVVQSFPGPNYLRTVLRAAAGLLRDRGVLFLGNLWDGDRREALAESVRAHRRAHGGEGADPSDGFFVPRGMLDALRHDVPEIARIDAAPMRASADNELAAFTYDALLTVDRTAPPPAGEPVKRQWDRRALEDGGSEMPDAFRAPESLAYLIYTSGSTGTPKGVQVPMSALVGLCHWYRDFCPLDAESRVMAVIPCSFDASVKNLVAPLLFGGRVVCFPEGPYDPAQLLEWIRREGVTVLNPGVPAMVYPAIDLAAAGGWTALEGLRCLALGGEAPELERLRPWLASPGCGAALGNVYGPTECADISLCHRLSAAEAARAAELPVGGPVHNARAYVLDEDGRPTPPGVPGELWVAGDPLARGYRGDPAMTADRFRPDPFGAGGRIYRTGDLARRLPTGEVVYLGRRDGQVKLRGFRVELGEVETRLGRVPGVLDCAAALLRDAAGEAFLCAWIAPEHAPTTETIREELARVLPAHMVPTAWVRLDRLPRNLHGKLDRAALPAPDAPIATARVAPRTPLEAELCALWEELLGAGTVGVRENFFALGGHSLKVAALASRIRTRLGRQIPLTRLYHAQTVEAQAAWLEGARGEPTESGPVAHRLGGDGPPLFCFPPVAGSALAFAAAARHLPDLSVHAFDFVPGDDPVAAYADALARAQPDGAYRLCGYSAGGALAFQVARELERRGKEVERVLLVDAVRRVGFAGYTPEQADSFAEHAARDPRFAALADGPESRARLMERVRAFCAWYSAGDDAQPCAAPLTLLLAEAPSAWAETWRGASTGGLILVPGHGAHDSMLDEPHAAANAALLAEALRPAMSPVG